MRRYVEFFPPDPKIVVELDPDRPGVLAPTIHVYWAFGENETMEAGYRVRGNRPSNFEISPLGPPEQVDRVPRGVVLGEIVSIPIAAPPHVMVRIDAQLGRVLDVSNRSLSVPLRVHELQVAVSTQKIPFSQLRYFDPAIESLEWITVISTATDLAPKERRRLDIPDDPIALPTFGYSRALFSEAASDTPIEWSVAAIRLTP